MKIPRDVLGSNVDRIRRIQKARQSERPVRADPMSVALDPSKSIGARRDALTSALGLPHTHPGHPRHRHPESTEFHTHDWTKG
jgi:hypothetical protein